MASRKLHLLNRNTMNLRTTMGDCAARTPAKFVRKGCRPGWLYQSVPIVCSKCGEPGKMEARWVNRMAKGRGLLCFACRTAPEDNSDVQAAIAALNKRKQAMRGKK
jgi:hypothetical protein